MSEAKYIRTRTQGGSESWDLTTQLSYSGDASTLEGHPASYFLASSAYTSADILSKLLSVDGSGSGLDADLLDGQHGSYYAPVDNPIFTTKVTTPLLKVTSGAAAGNLLVSDASGDLSYLAAGTTSQILVGGGATNPVWTTATGTGAPVRAGSPVFTGTVSADIITASGIVTGKAFRTVGTSTDYNLLVRNGVGNALYVQQAAATGSIASFRYGSASAGAGTEVLAIDHNVVTSNVNVVVPSITVSSMLIQNSTDRSGLLEINQLSTTSYSGIQIKRSAPQLWSLMGSDGYIGLYDDTNSDWIIYAQANGYCDIRYNGSSKLTTTNTGVEVTGNITTVGGVHVGGTSDPGTDNLWVDGIAQEPNFTTGFAGSNWQVTAAGIAEFGELRVRGTIHAYELEINKITSINGGMIVSVANAKSTTYSGTTIYFDEGGGLDIPFQVNDYIKAQQFTGTGIASYLGLVTAVNAGNIVATTISGSPWNNMDLVQFGNTTDTDRQSAIYITASDTNNPFIAGYEGIDDGLFSGHEIFRLGNLTGAADGSGVGLYSQNVYLTGKITATSGAIGAWSINSTSIYTGTEDHSGYTANAGDITIYSDGSNASIHAKNFYIDASGNIVAQAGTLGGFTMNATTFAAGSAGTAGWATIRSDNGLFGWTSEQHYAYSQQSTPITLSAPIPYQVSFDGAGESILNLPSSGLPSSGTGTSMFITHAKGTTLGVSKYHIQGNGYYINRAGYQLSSIDIDEGNASMLVWDPRQGGQWYEIVPSNYRTPNVYNQSVASQSGFSSSTYVAGSAITVPYTSNGKGLQIGTRYHCIFDVTKTAAGTGTPIIQIRYGVAGTIADTILITHTFGAQTAAADVGTFEVWITFRTVGGTATIESVVQIRHSLAATGFQTVPSKTLVATSGAFNAAAAGNIIGFSIYGGASSSWTIQAVQSELTNLY